MKATGKEPKTGRLVGCLIAVFVIAGTVSLSAVADLDKGSGITGTLFIAFLGAIIAVQLIPGLMLFGMMVKGIAGMFHRLVAQRTTK
jgi:hypothetical protein